MYLAVVCRALIGITFLAAAAGKLHSRTAFTAFVADLTSMSVVPARYVRPVAVASVLAEAAGVVLALGAGLVAATLIIRLDDLVALFGDVR